ncbi:MAG: hypothetical protein FWD52_02325 [Candidatus Bathyarchaeota archaeon]|nr:hypothetical protein [Candidatus Termiticorpusculum sp.]
MKRLSLLLIVLMLSCGLVSVFGVAQAQSKPAIPTFTVKLVDNSYNIPPTQTTDPYTGTITKPGEHIKKIEIEITIKNQNYPTTIMYNIRTKGHFAQEWQNRFYATTNSDYGYPEQSKGQYTVITLHTENYPDGAKVDIQVEAMSGTISWEPDGTTFGVPGGDGKRWFFDGVTSGWSKTQTLTINKNGNEISNQPPDNSDISSDPIQQTSFSWIELIVITAVAVIIAVVTTLLILRKQLTQKHSMQ